MCVCVCSSDDHNRVKLLEVDGMEGSDYVNASFVDVRHTHTHTHTLVHCSLVRRVTVVRMPTSQPRVPCQGLSVISGG